MLVIRCDRGNAGHDESNTLIFVLISSLDWGALSPLVRPYFNITQTLSDNRASKTTERSAVNAAGTIPRVGVPLWRILHVD